MSLAIDESTWVVARCTEEYQLLSHEQLTRYNRPGSLSEEPCRLRYAHTSPIYVTVGAKGPHVTSSVRQAENMLMAFEGFARKTASPEYLPEILNAMPMDVDSRRR